MRTRRCARRAAFSMSAPISPQDATGLKEAEQVEFHFAEESPGRHAIVQISLRH